MSARSDFRYRCHADNCTKTIENPSKFVMIRAHYAGWYIQKNGAVWCQDHRPSWAPPLVKEAE